MSESTSQSSPPRRATGFLTIIGPGLLIAATGVGAGDLATAGLAGSKLGMGVMWAVLVGAFLKFVLNEGLARYQLVTGQTLLEGAVYRLGRPVAWIFLPYLLLWSFFVGSALISACGVALNAMIPVFEDAGQGKFVFGLSCSVLGVAMVRLGGFALFERVMRVCIVLMFITVLVTAVLLKPDVMAVLKGIFVPTFPSFGTKDMDWTIALMGGVGGTLTVLCYGYWIREKGRTSTEDIRTCRIDLAVGYTATAVFGLAMIVIASGIDVEGKGVKLIVLLADRLEEPLGIFGRWAFLIGAFGALFSSLLGVWQAVPYIFVDFWSMTQELRKPESQRQDCTVDEKSVAYRGYLAALALVPLLAVAPGSDFSTVQKIYSIIGAFFMPLLALVLLILNGRAAWVGTAHRNKLPTVIVLTVTLLFFGWIGYGTIGKKVTDFLKQFEPAAEQLEQSK